MSAGLFRGLDGLALVVTMRGQRVPHPRPSAAPVVMAVVVVVLWGVRVMELVPRGVGCTL